MESRKIVFEISANQSVISSRADGLLEGVFSEIPWLQMTAVADYFIKLVSKKFGTEYSDFIVSQAMRDKNDVVVPILRVIYSGDVAIEETPIGELLKLASDCILNEKRSSQGDLFFDSNFDVDFLENEIVEFLNKNGSKRLKVPLQVSVLGERVADLNGKFSLRPSDIINQVEIQKIQGQVVMVDSDRRIFSLKKSSTKLNSAERISFSDVFLLELSHVLGERKICEISFVETLDATGKKFLDLRDVFLTTPASIEALN